MRRIFRHLTNRDLELGVYALVIIVLSVASCAILWVSSGVFRTLWSLICAVVEPLAYGAMASYVLNPLVKFFSHALRRYPRFAEDGMRRRTTAVIITVGLIALVLFGLLLGLAAMLTHRIAALDWSTIETIFADITGDLNGFLEMVQERLVSWGLISAERENFLMSAMTNVTNVASTVLFSVIFAVYFLIDGKRLFAYFRRVAHNVLGGHDVDVTRLMDDADRVFSGYFRGQALDAVVVGVLTAIALSIVGVPYAPVVGLLTGIGNLIPYVGGPVGYGSIIVVCLSEQLWVPMIAGLIAMSVVMFVDGNILNPRLLSNSIEVHPMLVVIALIAGGSVGGIAGMLVAVPVAAWLKIQLDRWMDAREAAGENLVDEIAGAFEDKPAASDEPTRVS